MFPASWRKQRIEISYKGQIPIEVMTDVRLPYLKRAERLRELEANFHGFCVVTLRGTNVKMNSEGGLIRAEWRVSCKISKV